jgi:hypothetical protein
MPLVHSTKVHAFFSSGSTVASDAMLWLLAPLHDLHTRLRLVSWPKHIPNE